MQTYEGGCHCGAVRFETRADLSQVIECNCSNCAMRGLLLTFVEAPQFTLRSGEDNLTDYRFNKRTIEHLFCKSCGIESFGRGQKPDGTPMVAINVRCLDGVDLAVLNRVPVDGKNY